MAFIDEIKKKARAVKKTIVLPESMDRRTWEAVETVLKEDIANVVVLRRLRLTARVLKFQVPLLSILIPQISLMSMLML